MTPNAQPTRVESFDRSALASLLEPPYTDPYVRWCGRGGAARLPPIPIPDPLRICCAVDTPRSSRTMWQRQEAHSRVGLSRTEFRISGTRGHRRTGVNDQQERAAEEAASRVDYQSGSP